MTAPRPGGFRDAMRVAMNLARPARGRGGHAPVLDETSRNAVPMTG